MKNARIALIENLYEAYKHRDIATVFASYAPDTEIYQTPQLPWGGHYKGIGEAGAFFGKLTTNISSEVNISAIFAAGEKVVAIGRTQGQVMATGKNFDIVVSHVYDFDASDKICKAEFYIDTPAMLEALHDQHRI